ncbi:MAG: DUF3592 domain-containing protein [Thermomicrobiales bacterium]|nr:DUF3592 domain-containing protein [Thermomicrobiales bacterium]
MRREGQPRRAEEPPTIPLSFVIQMRIFDALRNCIPVMFIGLAGLALTYSIDAKTLAVDSRSWPTASGVVTASRVVDDSYRTNDFEPYVTYSYAVAGKPYVGDVVRSGGFDYRSQRSAEAKLADYPVGSTVAVRYDPDDPSRAVLESGGGGDWWLIGAAGVAAGIVGLYLLVGVFRGIWAHMSTPRDS